jgi:type II secretory pathway component GspD/PulD (secretin)
MRTHQFLSFAVIALITAAPAARVFAQADAPAATPPPATPATLADKPAAADAPAVAAVETRAAPTKGKDAAGRDTLSVDFPDEDIRNILRNVADLFELNIIMPESLQGKTTIKLRDVTWRQIFTNVLDPVGYAAVEDGNIIKIVSKETLNDEPVTTEVFLINYARAADILPTITSLVDPAKGKIVVDSRSNSLVITERPTRMGRIKPIIEQLDRATDQVMIESKFVEVTDRDVKNIGVNWSSLANYNLSVGPKSGSPLGTFDRTRGQTGSDGVNASNGTTVNNTNGTNSSNNTSTTNTQTNGATQTTTVTSTNGTPTVTSSTGNTGALQNTITGTIVNGVTGANDTTANSALNLLNSIANTNATNRAVSAVFNADEFRLVLSALQTQNDVKIVSNPTIVTLNNSEATIKVGEEDPIPNYTYNQERGSFEVSGFVYKPIGIILKVTPQVNNRGFIKLKLNPEVSQKNGSTTFGGAGGASIPIVATRSAITEVSLKDGFTMGIGGLLTSQSTTGVSKIPVLGSMPLLGRLFRSDSKDMQVTNLIIFITAKTISAEGATVEQVFESSRVRQLELRREDLPGYRDGSSPYIDSNLPPKKTSSSRLANPEAKK